MAQAPQLALDPGVAPRRTVAGQAEDQFGEFCRDRRTSRESRLSPLARYQPPVPAQHRAGGDQPVGAKVSGQKPDQRREQRTVGPVQAWLRIDPPQDPHLMAQDEQLNVLGRAAAPQQHQPGGYPAEQKVDHTPRHEHHHPLPDATLRRHSHR